MATTVICDCGKTEIKGPPTLMMDGGIYHVHINAFHVPMGVEAISDLCARCLVKKILGSEQGVAA